MNTIYVRFHNAISTGAAAPSAAASVTHIVKHIGVSYANGDYFIRPFLLWFAGVNVSCGAAPMERPAVFNANSTEQLACGYAQAMRGYGFNTELITDPTLIEPLRTRSFLGEAYVINVGVDVRNQNSVDMFTSFLLDPYEMPGRLFLQLSAYFHARTPNAIYPRGFLIGEPKHILQKVLNMPNYNML